MRKLLLLLIICVLFTSGSFDAAQYTPADLTEEEALATAFNSTGAEVMESTISCWAKLNNSFTDRKQIEIIMKRVVDFMELDNIEVVQNVENDDALNKLVLYGVKNNRTYNLVMESVRRETGGETYVVLDVFIDKDYKGLSQVRREIIAALQLEEACLNFSSCIVGTYEGELTKQESDRKSQLALQSIAAKQIEGIEDDSMKSISAFSNNVGGYVMSDRNRVNVQLAIRYSSYDDRTYIWIGTPLIPMGY